LNAPETTRIAAPSGLGSGGYHGAVTASLSGSSRWEPSRWADPAQCVAGMHRASRGKRKQVANRCFDCGAELLFG